MTTPTRTVRRPTWIAVPLGLALVGALALSPALAQDGAATDAADTASADAATEASARRGAWSIRRGPDGVVRARGPMGGTWFGAPGFDAPRSGAPGGAMAERLRARVGAPGAAWEGAPSRGAGGDAFARWLAADTDAGPLVPGLIGRVADGTTVRLVFYAGAPDDGGTSLGDLSFVAGTGDVAAFRDDVRTAAAGATHVVMDVLGRVVALPEVAPPAAAE